jgi:hypothetical protein
MLPNRGGGYQSRPPSVGEESRKLDLALAAAHATRLLD